MTENKVALFGAAGAIGTSIAAAFRNEGRAYRVVGRSRNALQKTFGEDSLAEIVTWNPGDPASVVAAARGVETVIYLVGVNYWQFELHPVLMQKTLDGAIAAGVQNLLLVGTVYPYGMPQTTPVDEDHPRQPHTFKGQMRKKQEDLLFAANAEGKIRAAEVRLPDFYGPGVDKSFLWSAFQAAHHGSRAQLIGPIDTPHEFLFVPDVGPVIVKMIDEPRVWGHAWHLAGSGSITTREFANKIFAAAGRKPKYMVAGKTMLRLFGLFNRVVRELMEMNYLLTNPVLLDDRRLQALIGPTHKTSYDQGIKQTLAALEKQK